MTRLDPAFLRVPLAHRGRHGPGVPENSRAAVAAALREGWGIEIDLQMSSDGQPMVFHDPVLDRLTPETGPFRDRTAAELAAIPLPDGAGIPTLGQILSDVAGRVPLLLEVKDQTGTLGPGTGALEAAVAETLAGYEGPVAAMSFNPHAVAALAAAAPDLARGLTTDPFDPDDWPGVPPAALPELRAMDMFDAVGASFVSHNAADLASPHVARLKARGVPVLCWTIRSAAAEAAARRVADTITFEGYTPARP